MVLKRSSIQQEFRDIREKYGPWTAHNIKLGDRLFTRSAKYNYDNIKLNRITQLVDSLRRADWSDLRVLDLACQDGMYSIECALKGANVLGIEIREAHLARANFAKQALGLPKVTFERGDVRDVSLERDGTFDVILVLGLLYHLTAEDSARLLERLACMCRHFVIINTHVSLEKGAEFIWKDCTYRGRWQTEHPAGSTQEQKAQRVWYSWDNDESFVFTEESLLDLLWNAGFRVVTRCLVPFEPHEREDRITLVAIKGAPCPLQAFPGLDPRSVTAQLCDFEVSRLASGCAGRWGLVGRVLRKVRRAMRIGQR